MLKKKNSPDSIKAVFLRSHKLTPDSDKPYLNLVVTAKTNRKVSIVLNYDADNSSEIELSEEQWDSLCELRYQVSADLERVDPRPLPSCDGNHRGPACEDPSCWHNEPVTPLNGGPLREPTSELPFGDSNG